VAAVRAHLHGIRCCARSARARIGAWESTSWRLRPAAPWKPSSCARRCRGAGALSDHSPGLHMAHHQRRLFAEGWARGRGAIICAPSVNNFQGSIGRLSRRISSTAGSRMFTVLERVYSILRAFLQGKRPPHFPGLFPAERPGAGKPFFTGQFLTLTPLGPTSGHGAPQLQLPGTLSGGPRIDVARHPP